MGKDVMPMKNHQQINQTSGKWEYRTQPFIIDAARRVMGSIDLDVASCEAYNEGIGAAAILTLPPFEVVGEITSLIPSKGKVVTLPVRKFQHTGALARSWRTGNVWMNHPFGSSQQPCKPGCTRSECLGRGWHTAAYLPGNADWVNKFVGEFYKGNFSQGICIAFAATSEAWARPLLQHPTCFLAPRTNYLDESGREVKGVTKGSMVTYLGRDLDRFAWEFSVYGEVKVSYYVQTQPK